ncbi:MAG TPA: ribose 5-phosphate isomerase B [Candidatus Margulisiibacteriota bacterium]|nr:ribose 5-phosphate isomerase B [Candidatus Margulisiibacteriota bacterium]
MKNILIASDHAGFRLKERLKDYLSRKGFCVKDLGVHEEERCDYPLYAASLARLISSGKSKKGILICKSGIGNSIVANRFPRVRAALCYNLKAARLSREHNDSNVLVLGSAFMKKGLAEKIVSVWLDTSFQGGRHARRLSLIRKIEKEIGAG